MSGKVGKRILVIGCSGAGKSSLAKQLAQRTKLPLTHLDRLYWKPNWQARTSDEMDALLKEAMDKPSWILDGNFNRTLEMRLQACDTVIYLDYSTITCLIGVLRRRIHYRGQTRDDMGEGCVEKLDWQFLSYIYHFKKSKDKRYQAMLEQAAKRGVTVVTLKNRKQATTWLDSIETA